MGKPPAPKTTSSTGEWFNLREYLDRYGIEVVGEKPHGSAAMYLLRECVFDSSHSEKEAAIGQTSAGLLFYQCFHHSCKDKKWADVRK